MCTDAPSATARMHAGVRSVLTFPAVLSILTTFSSGVMGARVPVPLPVDDCCPKGQFCCGTGCLADELAPLVLCAADVRGCCGIEPKDCCTPDAPICCGSKCISEKEAQFTDCLVGGSCCDPPPAPPVDDCCPKGKRCCVDKCIDDGEPILCGPLMPGGCCEDPPPPPPPLDCCPKGKRCCFDKCIDESEPILCGPLIPGGCCEDPPPPPPPPSDQCCSEFQCCPGFTCCGGCVPEKELREDVQCIAIACCTDFALES